jgi:predicted phage terminase large subunit-like protein
MLATEERRELAWLPELVEMDRELAERSLREYVEIAFPIVEPRQRFVPGFHIDAICEHLEAVLAGQIRDLIINIPPGHMKSLLCGVLFPTWAWRKRPELRFLCGSYAYDLAKRDSLKSGLLVNSDWYRARWPEVVIAKDSEREIETSLRGFRMATSVDGGATGRHAHGQIIDDPLKAAEGQSKAARESAVQWVKTTMTTRRLPGGWRILVMQRLHEGDPAGVLMREGGWELLRLPEEFEPRARCFVQATGWKDPRTKEGELLWPQFFSADDHASRKKDLGSYGTAGQLQQRPSPEEGGIVKRSMLRRYSKLPERFDMLWQSWDGALSNTSDPWAGGVFGSVGPDVYLLPGVVARLLTFPQAIDVMRMWHERHAADEAAIVIENKAGGKPAIDTLKLEDVPALTPFDPGSSDKTVRLHAVVPFMEAGNYHVPSEELDPNIGAYVDELITFPNADHDDQVDMTTQAILWWRKNRGNYSELDLSGGERTPSHRIT